MTDERIYTEAQVQDMLADAVRRIAAHYQRVGVSIIDELYDAGIELSERLGLTDDKLGAEYEQWADQHDAQFEWPEA